MGEIFYERYYGCVSTALHEVVLLQVVLQYRVLHRREHEPDVLRVCNIIIGEACFALKLPSTHQRTQPERTGRTSEMGVDDLVGVGVEVDEHLEYEFSRGDRVSGRACRRDLIR